MRFFADLHVHSRYSRATSSQLTLEEIYRWSKIKGITLVTTGDVTHPQWLSEIRERLEEDGTGLLRLKESHAGPVDESLPPILRDREVRFILGGEVSCIYKALGKVRKVHLMVYLPSIADAVAFSEDLARRGNIHSDGRPILGIDAREVLELTLAHNGFMIPAHIWTPWFSVLGSKGGFDSLEDAFGDLLPEIFALETGLSSDPAMNRMLSSLDGYRLVSSSDAHNPQNIAREATAFDTDLSWEGVVRALRDGEGHLGTVEFFPEEGKYFLDGHRACGIRLDPRRDPIPEDGRCPVCGRPLTIGVLHRVLDLADRDEPADSEYLSLIPLPEIMSEIRRVASPTPQVMEEYLALVGRVGPELDILASAPIEAIEEHAGRILAEGIRRLREGRVYRDPGYDGRYGVISVFEPGELDRLTTGGQLFADLGWEASGGATRTGANRSQRNESAAQGTLDPSQKEAVEREGSVVVVAGPGSGKTRTLVARIRHLVEVRGVDPESICAVTFTRRAALELHERLGGMALGFVGTIHSLAYRILASTGEAPQVASEEEVRQAARDLFGASGGKILENVALARARGEPSVEGRLLDRHLASKGLVDVDALVPMATSLIRESGHDARFFTVLVDEAQDLNRAQYDFLMALGPAEWFLIGDPDQAIYGFRGASSQWMHSFPGTSEVVLEYNYRSVAPIVRAASRLIGRQMPTAVRGEGAPVILRVAASPRSEGVLVSKTIEELVGGVDFLSVDSGSAGYGEEHLSPSDIAVIYRVSEVGDAIEEMLKKRGIPVVRGEAAPWPEPIVRILEEIRDDRALFSMDSDEIVEMAARSVDTERYAPHLSRLANLAHIYPEGAQLVEAALAPDPAAQPGEGVLLMTAHGSKGLEFPVVFVVGLEEGTLPLHYGGTAPEGEALEEERRLLYVAMTRARDRLYLSHARTRRLLGGVRARGMSRFVEAISDVVVREGEGARRRRSGPETRTLF